MVTTSRWRATEQRLARRWDREVAADLTGAMPTRRPWTPAVVALLALGAVLVTLDLALLGVGIWLLASWRGPLLAVVGVVAVLLAWELRPRFGRLDAGDGVAVTAADAPVLHDLVRRTAEALGTPVPGQLLIGGEFTAWSGRFGWRRRSALYLGLPLWLALDGAGQVALLGHELGHLVNGDPRRGVLTGVVTTTCARLADAFTPGPRFPLLVRVTMLPVRVVLLVAQRLLVRLAARDGQRSEYLADGMAVRAGGTAGGVEVFEALLLASAIETAIDRAARADPDLARWRRAATDARRAHRFGLAALEERSTEVSSLRASHPPLGLRLRVVRSWAGRGAAVTPAAVHVVDRELQPHARRVARQFELS